MLGGKGLFVGLLVHESQHQNVLCCSVLDDGWDEAVEFGEINHGVNGLNGVNGVDGGKEDGR